MVVKLNNTDGEITYFKSCLYLIISPFPATIILTFPLSLWLRLLSHFPVYTSVLPQVLENYNKGKTALLSAAKIMVSPTEVDLNPETIFMDASTTSQQPTPTTHHRRNSSVRLVHQAPLWVFESIKKSKLKQAFDPLCCQFILLLNCKVNHGDMFHFSLTIQPALKNTTATNCCFIVFSKSSFLSVPFGLKKKKTRQKPLSR